MVSVQVICRVPRYSMADDLTATNLPYSCGNFYFPLSGSHWPLGWICRSWLKLYFTVYNYFVQSSVRDWRGYDLELSKAPWDNRPFETLNFPLKLAPLLTLKTVRNTTLLMPFSPWISIATDAITICPWDSDMRGFTVFEIYFLDNCIEYFLEKNTCWQVLDGLTSIVAIHRQAEDSIKRLNSCLLTITEVSL